MNIKRMELVKQLIDKHGYTKSAAMAIVDDFADIILDNMREGNSVSIQNFGCFDILLRNARSCPNPQTGEKIDIPKHYVPRFYPSDKMRTAVKLWERDDCMKSGVE